MTGSVSAKAEDDDVPFTAAELSRLKGLYSDFWGAEDHSEHALFRDELPSDISQDATLSALQLLSDEKLISGAEQLKHWREVGNELYKDSLAFEKLNNIDLKKRRLRDAISAYTKALGAECDNLDECRSVIHANRALCFFKLGKYAECVDDAKFAVVNNPSNIKGYFHAARGSLALGLHKRALSFVEEAHRQLPRNVCADLDSIHQQLLETIASRKSSAETRTKQVQRADEILYRVIQARGISWRQTSPFDAPLGKPRITDSNIIAWPILLLMDEVGTSEALDYVEETVSISDIMRGLFSQNFIWNVDKSYTPENVILSIWTGEDDDKFVDLEDPAEPLHSAVKRCSTIHRYLVMKGRRQIF